MYPHPFIILSIIFFHLCFSGKFFISAGCLGSQSGVQTKPMLPLLILSEVMPGSDKISASSLGFVRSQPGSDKIAASPLGFVRSHTEFRQNLCLSSGFCPKSHGFGQNRYFLSWFCPKSYRVQTKSLPALLVLSEVIPSSDKISAYPLGFVRSHTEFRQNLDASSLGFVRSHTGFRQNRGQPSWFCPKPYRVQTKSLPILRVLSEVTTGSDKIDTSLLVLSEVIPSSDKISAYPRGFVRSHNGFGQNRYFLSWLCPKSYRIQTKSLPILGVLSEVTTGSDKIAASSLNFVRSHTSFRQSRCFSSWFCPTS